MSEENLAIVRAANDAFLSGDAETALGLLDPDVEWHGTIGGFDEGRVAHGRDEVVQGFLEYFENWERMDMRVDDYIDAGGDEVVVFHHEVAKGRESGAVVETDTATVNTVGDGKIVRVRSYMDRAEDIASGGGSGRRAVVTSMP